jgi:hypothetical protein
MLINLLRFRFWKIGASGLSEFSSCWRNTHEWEGRGGEGEEEKGR